MSLKSLFLKVAGVVMCVGMIGCASSSGVTQVKSATEPAPSQIYIGGCGDWRWTRPAGFVVGTSDAKGDRMAAIEEAIVRAREQVAARMGAKVYQGVLDSTNMNSLEGQNIFRTLAQHVTDQAVSLSYPVAYFGIWKDNRETWYTLMKFSANEELQSLKDQRTLIAATLSTPSLDASAKELVQQQLDRVDQRIGELSGPYAPTMPQDEPYDPVNCREVGVTHLPGTTLEGHPEDKVMWTHSQPARYRYFLGISGKVSGELRGSAERQAILKGRSQVAAFLKSSIQQDFVSAYHGETGISGGEVGGSDLQGALLQEVAGTVSRMQPRYSWGETFEHTGHYRSTILMEFDYQGWILDRLRAEYDKLKAQLAQAEAAAEAGAEADLDEQVEKLRKSVEATGRMIERQRAGMSGAENLRGN